MGILNDIHDTFSDVFIKAYVVGHLNCPDILRGNLNEYP